MRLHTEAEMTDTKRLVRIRVEDLFNRHTYDIDLTRPITLITSPNGYGKTTILKLIQILSEKAFYRFKLEKYIFKSLSYFFSDDTELRITYKQDRKTKNLDRLNQLEHQRSIQIALYQSNKKQHEYELVEADFIDTERLSLFMRSEYGLVRIDDFLWRDNQTGSLYDYEQALALFRNTSEFSRFDSSGKRFGMHLPNWLKDINIPSMTINANRLQKLPHPPEPSRTSTATSRRSSREIRNLSVVQDISERIKQEYANVLSEQFTLSRNLESTFVNRLLNLPKENQHDKINLDEYRTKIHEYEEKFIQLNLIKDKLQHDVSLIEKNTSYHAMIGLYYQDILQRFKKMEPVANRLKKFTDTINRLYDHIKLETSESGIKAVGNDDNIDLLSLSSGQQHLLVILGKLFFELQDNCILYIDEPEISLHGSWQLEIIEIIKHATEDYSNVQVIIATHSPLIFSRFIESHGIIDLSKIDEVQHD